jgi:hypothetical protein
VTRFRVVAGASREEGRTRGHSQIGRGQPCSCLRRGPRAELSGTAPPRGFGRWLMPRPATLEGEDPPPGGLRLPRWIPGPAATPGAPAHRRGGSSAAADRPARRGWSGQVHREVAPVDGRARVGRWQQRGGDRPPRRGLTRSGARDDPPLRRDGDGELGRHVGGWPSPPDHD